MDFLLKFLILGGQYLTKIAAQSLIEAYKRSIIFGNQLNQQYERAFCMAGDYDHILDMYNTNLNEFRAANSQHMHLAFISDQHRVEFENYLKSQQQLLMQLLASEFKEEDKKLDDDEPLEFDPNLKFEEFENIIYESYCDQLMASSKMCICGYEDFQQCDDPEFYDDQELCTNSECLMRLRDLYESPSQLTTKLPSSNRRREIEERMEAINIQVTKESKAFEEYLNNAVKCKFDLNDASSALQISSNKNSLKTPSILFDASNLTICEPKDQQQQTTSDLQINDRNLEERLKQLANDVAKFTLQFKFNQIAFQRVEDEINYKLWNTKLARCKNDADLIEQNNKAFEECDLIIRLKNCENLSLIDSNVCATNNEMYRTVLRRLTHKLLHHQQCNLLYNRCMNCDLKPLALSHRVKIQNAELLDRCNLLETNRKAFEELEMQMNSIRIIGGRPMVVNKRFVRSLQTDSAKLNSMKNGDSSSNSNSQSSSNQNKQSNSANNNTTNNDDYLKNLKVNKHEQLTIINKSFRRDKRARFLLENLDIKPSTKGMNSKEKIALMKSKIFFIKPNQSVKNLSQHVAQMHNDNYTNKDAVSDIEQQATKTITIENTNRSGLLESTDVKTVNMNSQSEQDAEKNSSANLSNTLLNKSGDSNVSKLFDTVESQIDKNVSTIPNKNDEILPEMIQFLPTSVTVNETQPPPQPTDNTENLMKMEALDDIREESIKSVETISNDGVNDHVEDSKTHLLNNSQATSNEIKTEVSSSSPSLLNVKHTFFKFLPKKTTPKQPLETKKENVKVIDNDIIVIYPPNPEEQTQTTCTQLANNKCDTISMTKFEDLSMASSIKLDETMKQDTSDVSPITADSTQSIGETISKTDDSNAITRPPEDTTRDTIPPLSTDELVPALLPPASSKPTLDTTTAIDCTPLSIDSNPTITTPAETLSVSVQPPAAPHNSLESETKIIDDLVQASRQNRASVISKQLREIKDKSLNSKESISVRPFVHVQSKYPNRSFPTKHLADKAKRFVPNMKIQKEPVHSKPASNKLSQMMARTSSNTLKFEPTTTKFKRLNKMGHDAKDQLAAMGLAKVTEVKISEGSKSWMESLETSKERECKMTPENLQVFNEMYKDIMLMDEIRKRFNLVSNLRLKSADKAVMMVESFLDNPKFNKHSDKNKPLSVKNINKPIEKIDNNISPIKSDFFSMLDEKSKTTPELTQRSNNVDIFLFDKDKKNTEVEATTTSAADDESGSKAKDKFEKCIFVNLIKNNAEQMNLEKNTADIFNFYQTTKLLRKKMNKLVLDGDKLAHPDHKNLTTCNNQQNINDRLEEPTNNTNNSSKPSEDICDKINNIKVSNFTAESETSVGMNVENNNTPIEKDLTKEQEPQKQEEEVDTNNIPANPKMNETIQLLDKHIESISKLALGEQQKENVQEEEQNPPVLNMQQSDETKESKLIKAHSEVAQEVESSLQPQPEQQQQQQTEEEEVNKVDKEEPEKPAISLPEQNEIKFTLPVIKQPDVVKVQPPLQPLQKFSLQPQIKQQQQFRMQPPQIKFQPAQQQPQLKVQPQPLPPPPPPLPPADIKLQIQSPQNPNNETSKLPIAKKAHKLSSMEMPKTRIDNSHLSKKNFFQPSKMSRNIDGKFVNKLRKFVIGKHEGKDARPVPFKPMKGVRPADLPKLTKPLPPMMGKKVVKKPSPPEIKTILAANRSEIKASELVLQRQEAKKPIVLEKTPQKQLAIAEQTKRWNEVKSSLVLQDETIKSLESNFPAPPGLTNQLFLDETPSTERLLPPTLNVAKSMHKIGAEIQLGNVIRSARDARESHNHPESKSSSTKRIDSGYFNPMQLRTQPVRRQHSPPPSPDKKIPNELLLLKRMPEIKVKGSNLPAIKPTSTLKPQISMKMQDLKIESRIKSKNLNNFKSIINDKEKEKVSAKKSEARAKSVPPKATTHVTTQSEPNDMLGGKEEFASLLKNTQKLSCANQLNADLFLGHNIGNVTFRAKPDKYNVHVTTPLKPLSIATTPELNVKRRVGSAPAERPSPYGMSKPQFTKKVDTGNSHSSTSKFRNDIAKTSDLRSSVNAAPAIDNEIKPKLKSTEQFQIEHNNPTTNKVLTSSNNIQQMNKLTIKNTQEANTITTTLNQNKPIVKLLRESPHKPVGSTVNKRDLRLADSLVTSTPDLNRTTRRGSKTSADCKALITTDVKKQLSDYNITNNIASKDKINRVDVELDQLRKAAKKVRSFNTDTIYVNKTQKNGEENYDSKHVSECATTTDLVGKEVAASVSEDKMKNLETLKKTLEYNPKLEGLIEKFIADLEKNQITSDVYSNIFKEIYANEEIAQKAQQTNPGINASNVSVAKPKSIKSSEYLSDNKPKQIESKSFFASRPSKIPVRDQTVKAMNKLKIVVKSEDASEKVDIIKKHTLNPIHNMKTSLWNWETKIVSEKQKRMTAMFKKREQEMRKEDEAFAAAQQQSKEVLKKYRFERKEIKPTLGKPIVVTYLVEDNDDNK